MEPIECSIVFKALSCIILIIARTLWEVHVLGQIILDVCGEKPSLYKEDFYIGGAGILLEAIISMLNERLHLASASVKINCSF